MVQKLANVGENKDMRYWISHRDTGGMFGVVRAGELVTDTTGVCFLAIILEQAFVALVNRCRD